MRIVLFFTVAILICFTTFAGAPVDALKRGATLLGNATVNGDIDSIIDGTHESVLKISGGRENMRAALSREFQTMAKQGFVINGFDVLNPKAIHKADGKLFSIIPTVLRIDFLNKKIRSKTFLLAISDDEGRTWKYLDGAGLATEEKRNRFAIVFPKELEFPAPSRPEILSEQ